MTIEEEVLSELNKPRTIYPLQQRLDPSSKSTDALHDRLAHESNRKGGIRNKDRAAAEWPGSGANRAAVAPKA